MATNAVGSTGQPVLSERADVHKSCKSLETLVNVLNDYCEAAGAIVSLQKKLAKALRETAGLKVTGDNASNAMNASASIFEALSEIDSKFSKYVDKESESISAEVRKWFKKLAKEEKAHDERLNSANARIKQAGQVYEKKAKKKAADASEEHARYINLISSIGPEISQDKHAHALQVTQRHTTINHSVAACVSRVADGEWLRTCEGVRRFAPTIGQLGEWRALCEGGWTGPIPNNLPDDEDRQPTPAKANPTKPDDEEGPTTRKTPETSPLAPSLHAFAEQGETSPISLPPQQPHNESSSNYSSTGGQSFMTSSTDQKASPQQHKPPPSFSDNDPDRFNTLSNFPSPPTHFPIPPMSPTPRSNSQYLQPQSFQREQHEIMQENQRSVSRSPPRSTSQGHSGLGMSNRSDPPRGFLSRKPSFSKSPEIPRKHVPAPDSNHIQSSEQHPVSDPFGREDYDDREFGARNGGYNSRTVDAIKSRPGDRNDTTTSSGSVVAAIRNRYSYNSGAMSPGPRDIPRLPISVSEIANRYQPHTDMPLPPRRRTGSPPRDLQLSQLDTVTQDRTEELSYQESTSGSYAPGAFSSSPVSGDEEPIRQRHDRVGELHEREMMEKELREREREIEQRARELERDRANLMTVRRTNLGDGYTSDSSRGGAHSSAEPHGSSQRVEFPSSPPPQPRHSYSTNHLVPPSSSTSQPRSLPSQPPSRQTGHAEFCGCDSCSVAKYKTQKTPSPHDLRPPEPPINLRPDKPRGWIRRLSMPVGLILDSSTKKTHTNASSVNLRNAVVMPGEDGRFDRRSIETGGLSNRSMTNLRR